MSFERLTNDRVNLMILSENLSSILSRHLEAAYAELDRLQAENGRLNDKLENLKGEGWIKCSERMPDHEREVLVTPQFKFISADPCVVVASYWNGSWKSEEGIKFECEVTHWRELPSLPKE